MLSLWYFFALFIALLMGVSQLIHRSVLRKVDYVAYALSFQLFSALFFIPLFAIELTFPSEPEAWILALIASILWAAIAIVGFKAYKYTEISLKTPIGKSKVLFVLFFAALIVGEMLTFNRIIGSILIFIGVIIVAFKPEEKLGGFGDIGVKLTLLAALFGGAVFAVDKIAMNYFEPGLYGFLQYLLPTIWIGALLPKRLGKIKNLLKGKGKWVIFTSFLATGWTWMLFRSYQLIDVSLIAPILELSIIISTLGGIIFLKERKDIRRKIIGAAVIIAGALLVGKV